ncbi:hypothetical protein PC116_g18558 [Phytophthora cactorum]|uniref:Uncharacterized protein n=1 Tax=Phytophthora cactorum TaxID=29920 RepID=A0A329RCX2_9STRA|nr:hypothetical protein PC112_g15829 [Phytophthora cactorum]KAG2999261.1 hypothetical protein PC119_g17274 [Phytophthora cactorum]KAG3070371.1 hypothetical protein PC122_g16170 [Phytophthora cactorum]KAG4233232.1 hypothetical protein PC116_g18558 [Phytophthora cactorum]RAW21726.1 hypothetical protein PC110_g21831 [Phytophthora cactorum]
MSNPRVLNGPACEQLDDIPFRIVDSMKRSRFQSHDLLKLIRIVTRRQTYAAPHGQGEDEWQAVADELNETVEAAFSFRACRDKVAALLKEHKRATLTHRKNRADEAATTEEGGGQDDINKVQGDAERAGQTEHDERRELREMLGSAYSSEEEGNQEETDADGDAEGEGDDEVDSSKVGRKLLRVNEIWEREEAMMERDREAQAARDTAITKAVEGLANSTQMLNEFLARGAINSSNEQ